jgi:signal transduction histidine kinase
MRIYNFSGSSIIVALALLLLVPVLAYFQFHWLGQLSDRELDRMRINIRATGMRLRIDLHDAFLDPLRRVGGHLEGTQEQVARALTDRMHRWSSSSSYPGVIGDMYLVVPGSHETGNTIQRLDLQQQRFVTSTWSVDSAVVAGDFHNQAIWMEVETEPGQRQYVLRSLKGFVLSLTTTGEGGRVEMVPPPSLAGAKSPYVFFSFRWEYIRDVVLPAIVQTYVNSADKEVYEYVLCDRVDTTQVLWSLPSGLDLAALHNPDVAIGVGELPRLIMPPPFGPMRASPGGPLPEESFGVPASNGRQRFAQRPGDRDMRPAREGRYELRIKHHAGSLEAAVQQHRWRNLGISFGIIALLAGSVIMLLMAAHRSQDLARQQIEFVAGVSHELRTPLAVLKSVGDNLADGVITGKVRTREYGVLVSREVHRLASIVDNALEYAGIQSGRRKYEMQETSPLAVLMVVLRECEGMIGQAEMVLDLSVADQLPKILAEQAALQVAIQNIITNAIKYGKDGKWLGIRLATELRADGESVVYVVSDRGIGIEPEDRGKIFDAFYRGKNTRGLQIQGSGLGLSLAAHIVRAHKGKIEVTSARGKGSTFTVVLPVANFLKG